MSTDERIRAGCSRAEWNDKAWALFNDKTISDAALHKANIHTIRAVFDATYDALFSAAKQTEKAITDYRPSAWWIPKAEQFCIAPSIDCGRPFAKAWEPLYSGAPLAVLIAELIAALRKIAWTLNVMLQRMEQKVKP